MLIHCFKECHRSDFALLLQQKATIHPTLGICLKLVKFAIPEF
jgi:hypothetical protein